MNKRGHIEGERGTGMCRRRPPELVSELRVVQDVLAHRCNTTICRMSGSADEYFLNA